MCGRFTLTLPMEDIARRFELANTLDDYAPRYNIAPGQMIFAIIRHRDQNRIGKLQWGLIPSWSKQVSSTRPINARAETVHQKPAFRDAFLRKRCLIPADGFYEWKQTKTGKQPMRILLKSKKPFALAGLYDTWISPQGEKVHTCAIITTQPNGLMKDIHHRMPAILKPEHEKQWLDPSFSDIHALQSFLMPYPEEEMTAYPVSWEVNRAKNDSPKCIEPYSPSESS